MAFDVVTKVQISESDAARALGRKGGMARKAKLSDKQLTEIGKHGAAIRWGNRKDKTIVSPASGE